jgi:uncharacterized Zn finger protein
MTDTTHEAPELLPCPFCGGEAEHSVGRHADGKPWHYVECVDCGATGPNSPYADHNIAVIQFRAEEWNARSNDLVQAAVAAAERERNAKAAQSFGCCHVPQEIAAAIREGGK